MPELRDWAINGGGPAELSGGFFIRRVSSPLAAVTGQRRGRIVWVTDNKENVPPSWGVSVRRARPRKSPLPEWYPRTPLRDVTAVVNAVERRRSRLRAVAAQQRSRNPEVTSPSEHVTATSPEESNVLSQTPPIQDNQSIVSVNSSGPTVANTAASQTELLLTCSSPDLVPFADQSLQTASVSTNPSPTDLNKTAFERKLSSSIDEIERIVMENLKRSPKVAPPKKATQRSTLLSMR
ncbi:uncharacterized protein [Typha angustifolia]|uniref:uncharacterized protein n=1 Tax=Typha angustifolia TaxID=59011 RepID=UPI003C30E262